MRHYFRNFICIPACFVYLCLIFVVIYLLTPLFYCYLECKSNTLVKHDRLDVTGLNLSCIRLEIRRNFVSFYGD